MHLKSKILNSHCTEEEYFEDGSPENLSILLCGKALAFPKKKIRRRWISSGMLQFPKITEYHSKH